MMYRTYGKSSYLDTPYRLDKGNYNSSFITIGKIDNSYLGKYKESDKISFNKMILDFHYRSDASKWEILLDIFNQEKSILKSKMNEWVVNRQDSPIVEIANEPNLFPYMSPELYAKYYKLWFDEIKSINSSAKIMNGGLWINEGLPTCIVKNLPKMGIKETSVEYYFKKVISILGKEYRPNILGLHFYPYIGKRSTLSMTGHIVHLVGLIDELEINEVWLTEFGNINSYSMDTTKTVITTIIDELKRIPEIKQIYYYNVNHNDPKMDILAEMNNMYKKNKNIFNFIFGGLLSIFKTNSILEITNEYIKNPPIQSLESGIGLNPIGLMYRYYIESYKSRMQKD